MTKETIPFWRNTKTIGVLAQVTFVIVVLAGFAILATNVTSALSKANIPADFRWLDDRAGIPIAETPIPYTPENSYGRALVIGFLNTLKVALVGVVLATVLGVGVGVMRLASNGLLRLIATVYIELLRNIPLAVQIVFWYTAILLPLPPRISNPIELPGGALLSNVGLAIPWWYPSYRFGAWLPWIVAAVVLGIVVHVVRARAADRSERPLVVWPFGIGTALVVAVVGFGVASLERIVPDGAAVTFNVERGRGTVFVDENADGVRSNDERVLPFAPVRVIVESAELVTTTQNLTESRSDVASIFRFPLFREDDASRYDVAFVDDEAAVSRGYALHFDAFPSLGVVYVDADGSGDLDPGEEIDPATGQGYSGVALVLTVEGYARTIVADRDGQIRTPTFQAAGTAKAPKAEASTTSRRGVGVFAAPAPATSSEDAPEPLVARTELLQGGPMVWSRTYVPVSGYQGGIRFSVNYLALLFALVIYTSAYVGEIVRGGILAVSKGQREAAMSLGLRPGQVFSLVVFPQAMRIVLPPMISQFLNLTKNSSLAPLAAYGELFVIATIAANQTGASVPIALLLIVSYLLISLAFAFVLNIVNDRLALVER